MFEVKYSGLADVYIVLKDGITIAVLDNDKDLAEYLDRQNITIGE